MTHIDRTWRVLAAVSATATLLAACNDGTTGPAASAPPPASTTIDFSIFAQQAFSNSANSTPVPINSLTFNFDVNDNPTAFNALIADGMFGGTL